MKKVIIVLTALLAGTALFAADYEVKSVKGKVTYESAGKKIDVKTGQKLSDSTILNTGLNSSIVIVNSGKEIVIKAMQKGTVDELIKANVVEKGLKRNPSKTSAANSIAAAQTSKQGVATASSRASSAQEDFEWDE